MNPHTQLAQNNGKRFTLTHRHHRPSRHAIAGDSLRLAQPYLDLLTECAANAKWLTFWDRSFSTIESTAVHSSWRCSQCNKMPYTSTEMSRPSIHPSIRPSVYPSVRLSVGSFAMNSICCPFFVRVLLAARTFLQPSLFLVSHIFLHPYFTLHFVNRTLGAGCRCRIALRFGRVCVCVRARLCVCTSRTNSREKKRHLFSELLLSFMCDIILGCFELCCF